MFNKYLLKYQYIYAIDIYIKFHNMNNAKFHLLIPFICFLKKQCEILLWVAHTSFIFRENSQQDWFIELQTASYPILFFIYSAKSANYLPWLPNFKPRGRVSLNANTIIIQVLGSNIGLDVIQNKFLKFALPMWNMNLNQPHCYILLFKISHI